MALVKNKLSPVDQLLNTSMCSVLYVQISKLITDMAVTDSHVTYFFFIDTFLQGSRSPLRKRSSR